jgi:Ca2+-binding EF-hand superfamily protein
MKLDQLLHGLLALAVLASFAAAQDAGESTDKPDGKRKEAKEKKEKKAPRGNPVMKALDTDADQVISADELSKAPASLLALDKNKDGKLERTELGGRERPRREAGERPAGKEGDRAGAGLMGRFDTDGDGKLSKEEAPGPMKERFDEMDKNSDGFIDEKELAELRKGRGEGKGGEGGEARPERKRGERPEGRERPQGQRGRGGAGRRGMRGGERRPPQPGSGLMRALDTDRNRELSADEIKNATASLKKLDKNSDGQLSAEETTAQRRGRGDWFARFDKDGDGKLSKEEAPGRMKERFDDMDTNGDGFIDKKEQEELMERFRGGRGGRGGEGRRGRKEKEDDEEKSEE